MYNKQYQVLQLLSGQFNVNERKNEGLEGRTTGSLAWRFMWYDMM
jgi:hypothetical protein